MEIDTRGLECPVPTERAIAEMKRARATASSAVIVVVTDDAVCAQQIPEHARGLGFAVHAERAGLEWTITLSAPNSDRTEGN